MLPYASLPMSRILILKTGETAPEVLKDHGDYDRWFTDAMAGSGHTFDVRDVTRGSTASLPPVGSFAGVIVTGSTSAAYHREPWMDAAEDLLRRAVTRHPEVPMLAVCFGAQILAQSHGGRVIRNPEGWEIGGAEVTLTDEALNDPLFAGLPRRMKALATHEDRIEDLPSGATMLAGNPCCPIQAYRIGRAAWGVQFHPEATTEIIGKLIRLRAAQLERDAASRGNRAGGHVEGLLRTLEDPMVDAGRRVLENFATLCRDRD